jgi:uncharacterized protein YraI
MFAVAVIGGVAILTGTAVGLFFAQSSQSTADAAPAIAADEQPVLTASLDPEFPPVHKVLTKTYPALKADELPASKANGLPAPKAVRTTTVKGDELRGSVPVRAAAVKGDELLEPKPVRTTAVKPSATPAPQPAAAAVTLQPSAYAATRVDQAAVKAVDAAVTDLLEPQDPRWARTAAADANAAFAAVIPTEPVPNAPAADQAAGKSSDPADATRMAAVSPEDMKPKKAAQQSDDENATASDAPLAPGLSGSTRPAQVNKGVNMRSRGRSGASVVMTIPQAAVVQVVGCKSWCEVIYKGQRGFIYKDFISGGSKRTAANRSTKPRGKAAPADQTASNEAKTIYLDPAKPDPAKTDAAATDPKPDQTGSVDQGRMKFTSQHVQ